jgi:hypothetical protein
MSQSCVTVARHQTSSHGILEPYADSVAWSKEPLSSFDCSATGEYPPSIIHSRHSVTRKTYTYEYKFTPQDTAENRDIPVGHAS